MEKRGEIPGSKKSGERSFANAASKDAVEKMREEIEAIGWDWHEAVKAAGVSRNVGYTLLRGEGSVGSLRSIEEWFVKEAAKKRAGGARTPREEWMAIADELEKLGPDELPRTIEGLQEYLRAEKRRLAALRKIFRATPDGGR